MFGPESTGPPVSNNLNTILGAVIGLLGSGVAGLIIALLKRRPEIRQLDTQSDVNQSTAELNIAAARDKLIVQLQADGETNRGIVKDLQEQVERFQQRLRASEEDFTRQLQIAHEENRRLNTRIARLQNELDIAQRQIQDLSGRYPPDPQTRRA